MRYIGVDYGRKRVGIAVSDEGGKFAFPKAVIPANVDLAEKIVEFAENAHAKSIVIGESRDFGGRENPIVVSIDILKRQLEAKGFEVILEQELMSSFEAERFQGKSDMSDASAAAIILQRYLEKNRSEKNEK